MARPKRVFTDEEQAIIANYALDGGKNNTIASALSIPVNTLTNRFSVLLKEYRAYRKLKLARNQRRQSVTSPQVAIFLGINELGQIQKQEIVTKTSGIEAPITEAERIARHVGGEAYTHEIQRQHNIKLKQA